MTWPPLGLEPRTHKKRQQYAASQRTEPKQWQQERRHFELSSKQAFVCDKKLIVTICCAVHSVELLIINGNKEIKVEIVNMIGVLVLKNKCKALKI